MTSSNTKMASHDSVTGEESKGMLSKMVVPFARTQSKTLKEQYEAGVRLFDLRVRKRKGEWVCAHGCWTAKKTAWEALCELDEFGKNDTVYVALTYEGANEHNDDFLAKVHMWKAVCWNIVYGPVCVKYGKDSNGIKVKYDTLEKAEDGFMGGTQGFLPLDGRSWHTYLPIPWLWDKVYGLQLSVALSIVSVFVFYLTLPTYTNVHWYGSILLSVVFLLFLTAVLPAVYKHEHTYNEETFTYYDFV